MKTRKIRVEIEKIGSTRVPLYDESPASAEQEAGAAVNEAEPEAEMEVDATAASGIVDDETGDLQTGADATAGSTLEVSFSLAKGTLKNYEFSRYAHPAMKASFNVPEGDLPVVRSWFGETSTEVEAPSATLVKRLTEGAIGGFRKYVADASQARLFTSPFKAGCALRLADGTHTRHAAVRLVKPNVEAPLLLVHEQQLSGNTLATMMEIVNVPSVLTASVEPFQLAPGELPFITHLDFYATRQGSLLDGSEEVTGVRTFAVAGENERGWLYDRRREDEVTADVLADTDFRIIASVPIAEAMAGLENYPLPQGSVSLDNWDSLQKLAADDLPGAAEEEEGRPYTRVKIVTEALHLGYPEELKKVRGLTLRGIFRRDAGMRVRLYGSHHRERWHLVAEGCGAHLRFLRGVGYRWWLVEAECPRESRLEALTFHLRP